MKNRRYALRDLLRDKGGVSVVEFALIAPVFIGLIFAVSQMAMVFFAQAGLKNAVSEGARLATLYPRPSNADISAKIARHRFGVDPAYLTGPTFVDGTSNGAVYTEITMRYSAPVNFIFYDFGPITLTQTRRVYTQPPPPTTT